MSYSYRKSKFDIFIDEKYATFNKKHKGLIIGISTVIILCLFYLLFFQPNYEQIEKSTKPAGIEKTQFKSISINSTVYTTTFTKKFEKRKNWEKRS